MRDLPQEFFGGPQGDFASEHGEHLGFKQQTCGVSMFFNQVFQAQLQPNFSP